MSPVWIIEGQRELLDPVTERNAAERKLAALADAVRAHERDIGSDAPQARPQDQHLYHRLREICEDG
ncbi:MAG TPA: hypothetical protein VEK39_11505 [Solirubrobacterales bacterium]|nr:hypothetical protein [Solirubrobacterales bacterium]